MARRRLVRAFAVLPLSLCLAACSSSAPSGQSQPVSGDWLLRGSIVLASPLPQIVAPSTRAMLGFVPAAIGPRGMWLSIDAATGLAILKQGEKELQTVKIKSLSKLTPGNYELLLKQRDPLWHAPDEYFRSRKLPLPPAGDRSRYLRGALGDYVLYIDRNTPLHNAPAFTAEVGGILVSDDDIARLYYQLEVGSPVEVY